MAKKDTPGTGPARTPWLDERTDTPLFDTYSRRLDSFIQTMADGRVDEAEIQAQEARLVGLMKEVEPLLDDAQHEKVTRLLCELTAYDLMQLAHAMQQARPRTTFRG
jgi:hypothetical protein